MSTINKFIEGMRASASKDILDVRIKNTAK